MLELASLETLASTVDNAKPDDLWSGQQIRFELGPLGLHTDSPAMSAEAASPLAFESSLVAFAHCVDVSSGPAVAQREPVELLRRFVWVDGACVQVQLRGRTAAVVRFADGRIRRTEVITPCVHGSQIQAWVNALHSPLARLPASEPDVVADFDQYSPSLKAERTLNASAQPGSLPDSEWDD